MNEIQFEAKIVRGDAMPPEVVRERAYDGVRVTAGWPEDLTSDVLRVTLTVAGEFDRRNAPAYVELFFHDVYLLLNVAAPGSFGGTIAIRGADLRAHTLALSPRVFAPAKSLDPLPLAGVVAWYDSLGIGTRQIASTPVETALFQLLCLARREEDETESILRLAIAAEALLGRDDRLTRLFALRDAIAHGRVPTWHPMHDDALDASIEDATAEWIEVADEAARVVVEALREAARDLRSSGRRW